VKDDEQDGIPLFGFSNLYLSEPLLHFARVIEIDLRVCKFCNYTLLHMIFASKHFDFFFSSFILFLPSL